MDIWSVVLILYIYKSIILYFENTAILRFCQIFFIQHFWPFDFTLKSLFLFYFYSLNTVE